MGKRITQKHLIVKHLREHNSISSWEAYEMYGITQLATRIHELKKLGYEFEKTSVSKKNRYGNHVRFENYIMTKERKI